MQRNSSSHSIHFYSALQYIIAVHLDNPVRDASEHSDAALEVALPPFLRVAAVAHELEEAHRGMAVTS